MFQFQIEVACRAYHQEMLDDDGDEQDPNSEEGGVSPKIVGHNIYILCHQVITAFLPYFFDECKNLDVIARIW